MTESYVKYYLLLLFTFTLGCGLYNGDSSGNPKYFLQKSLGENFFYQGELALKDDSKFVFDFQQFGYGNVGYHYRLHGDYAIDGKEVQFQLADCPDSLTTLRLEEHNPSFTVVELIMAGNPKSKPLQAVNMSFSEVLGRLYFQVDKGDWIETIVDNNGFSYLNNSSVVGNSLRFKLKYSPNVLVPRPMIRDVFYSAAFPLDEVKNHKIVIQYNVDQCGCFDDIKFSGKIEKKGIELVFVDSLMYSGFYQLKE